MFGRQVYIVLLSTRPKFRHEEEEEEQEEELGSKKRYQRLQSRVCGSAAEETGSVDFCRGGGKAVT